MIRERRDTNNSNESISNGRIVVSVVLINVRARIMDRDLSKIFSSLRLLKHMNVDLIWSTRRKVNKIMNLIWHT